MIKAYATMMSYDVSDAEKEQAKKALLLFSHCEKLLKTASNYLNVIKTPFKNNPEMAAEDVVKAGPEFHKYRDTAIDHFNSFKEVAVKCVGIMKEFSSDTQTLKLMKSFISSIDELETKVNEFSSIFSDLKSKDFSKNVIELVDVIQAKCDSIDDIIDDRIKTHIQSNILATSWVDSVSSNLQMQVQEKTPLILDLFNKRQDQLNNAIKEKAGN